MYVYVQPVDLFFDVSKCCIVVDKKDSLLFHWIFNYNLSAFSVKI